MVDLLQNEAVQVVTYSFGGISIIWVIKKLLLAGLQEFLTFKSGLAINEGMNVKTDIIEELKSRNTELVKEVEKLTKLCSRYKIFAYHVLKHISTCSNCPERQTDRDSLELELLEIEKES